MKSGSALRPGDTSLSLSISSVVGSEGETAGAMGWAMRVLGGLALMYVFVVGLQMYQVRHDKLARCFAM